MKILSSVKMQVFLLKNQTQQLKERLQMGSTCEAYLQDMVTKTRDEII